MVTPRAVPGGVTLRASAADQLRLLDLQALDARLARLAHQRRTLPELAQLSETEGRLGQLHGQLVTVRTEADDVQREQDKYEADIEQVRQRMARDEQRMNAGAVGSAKELESLQHEIDSLKRRQAALEDDELVVMERLEGLQQQVAALTADADQLAGEVGDLTARRDAAFAEIDAEHAAVTADRAALAEHVPADLLALYEKIREQLGGVGAAALRQKRCEGCRLELTPTDIARLRDADDDAVLRCEECRRILVRTDESGL